MPRTDQVAVEELVRRLTDAVRDTEERILLRLGYVDALLGDVMAMVGARPSRDIGGTATVNGEGTVAELRGAGSVSVRSDVTAGVTTVTVNRANRRDRNSDRNPPSSPHSRQSTSPIRLSLSPPAICFLWIGNSTRPSLSPYKASSTKSCNCVPGSPNFSST